MNQWLYSAKGAVDKLPCVFCDIVKRKTRAHIIYEDEKFIAILDKYPVSVGHTLVLPRDHAERVAVLSEDDFSALFMRVRALNHTITSRLGASGSHISINDGTAANQLIPHVHVHIIPRSENDGVSFMARKHPREEEMDGILARLEVKYMKVAA